MGIGVERLVRHEVRTFGVRFPDRPLRQLADLAVLRWKQCEVKAKRRRHVIRITVDFGTVPQPLALLRSLVGASEFSRGALNSDFIGEFLQAKTKSMTARG
jgi:hypothetical protein